jgi:hypothetical protein
MGSAGVEAASPNRKCSARRSSYGGTDAPAGDYTELTDGDALRFNLFGIEIRVEGRQNGQRWTMTCASCVAGSQSGHLLARPLCCLYSHHSPHQFMGPRLVAPKSYAQPCARQDIRYVFAWRGSAWTHIHAR